MPTKFQSSLTAQEIENRLVNANTNKNFNDQLLIKHIEVYCHEDKKLLTIISEPFINDKIVELINTTNLVRICIPKSEGGSSKKRTYFKHKCPNSFFRFYKNKETEEMEHEYILNIDKYSGLTEEEFLEKKLILPITKKNLKINKDNQYYITYTINMNDIINMNINDTSKKYAEPENLDYDYTCIFGTFYKNPESTNNDDIKLIKSNIDIFNNMNQNNKKTLINKNLNNKFFQNINAFWKLGGTMPTGYWDYLAMYDVQSAGYITRGLNNDRIKTYSTIFLKKGSFPIYRSRYDYNQNYNKALTYYTGENPLICSGKNINKKTLYKQDYNSFCFAILKENYNQELYYMFDKKYKYFSKKLCHKYYLRELGITNYGILKHTFWLK